MPMKNKEAKRGSSSSSNVDSDEPKMDIKSILKDIEFLGKMSFFIFNLICSIGSLVLACKLIGLIIIGKEYCEFFINSSCCCFYLKI